MDSEFTLTRLRPGLWQFQNSVGNCATLVIGTEKALLFDTMTGLGDLLGEIRKLTSLPLVVVNSHGHFDHVGGNWQFDEVYLNRKDWPLMARNAHFWPEIQRSQNRAMDRAWESFHRTDSLRDLEEGMRFDLGGVVLETLALPGHTPGSMGLLLREEGILLVGDAISPEMCLFFPESMGVEVYLDTLHKIMALDLQGFVQGHFTRLFPVRVLPKLEQCAHLVGQGKGMAYVNSLVHIGRGRVHVLSVRDPDVGGIVCIITKEPGYDPEGLNART